MKRAAGIAALIGALVFAGVVYSARTVAPGHGILLLQTESNERLQQVLLWHPGAASAQPLGSSSDWILTPQWSPDGTSIAFAEEQGGWDDPAAYEIWTMGADGSGAKQLTNDVMRSNVFRADEPSWSPDGRRIVFVRETENKPHQALVIVKVATGQEKTLHASGFNPAWGKAGIAYVLDYRRIMLVSPTTGRSRILAPVTASALVWSSRGELAALQPDRILLFTAAGRRVGFLRVPFKKTNACGIAWSPDGKRLLVRTSRRVNGLWIVTPGTARWQRQSVTIGKSNFDNCAVSWR